MTWWPWVSRVAFDLVVDERNRLREQNDRLQDQLIRMTRKDMKMSEVPSDQRNGRKGTKIPDEVMTLIRAWESPAIQSVQMQRAKRLYADHGSWQPVVDALKEDHDG